MRKIRLYRLVATGFLYLSVTAPVTRADELSRAIRSGKLEKVEELLAAGTSLGTSESRGESPLEMALTRASPDIFLLLKNAGATWPAELKNASARDRKKLFSQAFHWIDAAQEGSPQKNARSSLKVAREVLPGLLRAGIVPSEFPEAQTLRKLLTAGDLALIRALTVHAGKGAALCLAIERRDRYWIEFLLEKKWKHQSCQNVARSESPLAAAIKASDSRTIRKLLTLGAGRKSRALVLAVARQDENLVLDLLEAGAERNFNEPRQHPDYSVTPLAAAIQTGNRRLFEILLANQADGTLVPAGLGISLVDLASRHRRYDMVLSLLEGKPLMRLEKLDLDTLDALGPIPDPQEALEQL
ncbi:MAG: hypothetical protein AAF725_21855, partial [Acidobacteriota bacterium]